MSGFFGQAAGLIFQGVSAATDMARGWGNRIQWHSLQEGQKLSKEQGKPAMIVIHTSSCPACRKLKPRFASSPAIEQLSQHFVMINVQDNEDPGITELKPDGGYIPRIMFTDAKGQVIREINSGNQQWKYFYGDIESICDSMKRASKQFGFSSADEKFRGQKQNKAGRRF